MKEDNYYLKLSGKVSIPNKADIGHNYRLVIEGSVTSENKEDNDDGSFSYISKFEPVVVEVIKATGETLKAKDPRKFSQKVRASISYMWKNNSDPRTEEEAYNATMNQVLLEIANLYEKGKS